VTQQIKKKRVTVLSALTKLDPSKKVEVHFVVHRHDCLENEVKNREAKLTSQNRKHIQIHIPQRKVKAHHNKKQSRLRKSTSQPSVYGWDYGRKAGSAIRVDK
jgi:hypothetical protein